MPEEKDKPQAAEPSSEISETPPEAREPETEPVEEEVEQQEPPANLTQKALDDLQDWRKNIDEKLNGINSFKTTLEAEREEEKAQHRKTIEGKEKHDGIQKESTADRGSAGEGAGSPSSRQGHKRLRIFRSHAAKS